MIDRQAIQPRADRRIALEAAELAIRLKEDLLHEVFALVGRPGHSRRQAVDARGVLFVERFERIDVTCLHAGHQSRIADADRH